MGVALVCPVEEWDTEDWLEGEGERGTEVGGCAERRFEFRLLMEPGNDMVDGEGEGMPREGGSVVDSRLFLLNTFPKNFFAPLEDCTDPGVEVSRESRENVSNIAGGVSRKLRRLLFPVGVAFGEVGMESRMNKSAESSFPPEVSVPLRSKEILSPEIGGECEPILVMP